MNASQVFYCCFNFYDKIFKKNGKSTLSFHGKLTPKHNGIIMHVIFKYLYAIQFVDNAFGPKSSDEINLKLTVKLQF